MNAFTRTTLLALAMLTAAPAQAASAVAPPVAGGQASSGAQASYVRVCRNTRGVADRRACHRFDEARTVIAMNF